MQCQPFYRTSGKATLTPLEPQSRFEGEGLQLQVICPQLPRKRDCSPKRARKEGFLLLLLAAAAAAVVLVLLTHYYY